MGMILRELFGKIVIFSVMFHLNIWDGFGNDHFVEFKLIVTEASLALPVARFFNSPHESSIRRFYQSRIKKRFRKKCFTPILRPLQILVLIYYFKFIHLQLRFRSGRTSSPDAPNFQGNSGPAGRIKEFIKMLNEKGR